MNATERLRDALICTHEKHETIAYRAGVSKATVSRVASGKVSPTLQTAERLADSLGIALQGHDLGDL